MTRTGLTAATLLLIVDQISKWIILTQAMSPPRVIEVTGFFNLVLAWNRGVSFSLFASDAAFMPYILSAIALLVTVGLFFWLRRQQNRLAALAIGLVMGGAVGNVIDRLRFGAVVDFLDFHLSGYHWPAFNLADSGITIGVILLLLESFFGSFWRKS